MYELIDQLTQRDTWAGEPIFCKNRSGPVLFRLRRLSRVSRGRGRSDVVVTASFFEVGVPNLLCEGIEETFDGVISDCSEDAFEEIIVEEEDEFVRDVEEVALDGRGTT